jgi:hypothetical protein
MPDIVITGEVLQVCCVFCTMSGCCIMLKPAVLFSYIEAAESKDFENFLQ